MQRIDAYFERVAQRWSWLSFGIALCLMFFSLGLMLNFVWFVNGASLGVVRTIAILAFLIGLILARVEVRWWMVLIVSTLLGGLVITSLYARVGDELLRGFQDFIFFSKTFYTAWRSGNQLPGNSMFMGPLFEYAKGMYSMLTRLGGRLLDLPSFRRDGLGRLMVWELGMWLSIIWVNWSVWKKSWVLSGLIPGLLLGGLVVSAAKGANLAFLLMFGCAIILIIIFSQRMREREWEQNFVGYSEYIREHSARAAVYLSIALVFGSGFLGSIDFEAIIERIREYRQGTSASAGGDDSFSSRRSSFDEQRRTLTDEFKTLSRGGFPMVNLIGTGPELAEHVVMYVEIDELNVNTGEYQPVTSDQGSVYLRALNYDRYNSHGWFSDTNRVFLYDPGQEAVWAYSSNQQLLRQDFSIVNDFTGLLTAVGQLAVVDLQYTIAWRSGSSPANFKDMIGAMVPKSEYRAYSLTPLFGEEELRVVSENYPDWVENRYMELPDSIPERVFDLAEELTGSADTVYDKAIALEQYLRTIPYSLDLPTKPIGQDLVDYFIFDIQTGYCDYYASAMVVMARHLGIPARLAVGYVTGNYDENKDHFIVTADQAHSWVEIYFPSFGWVTFEPTGGRPEISREPVREQSEVAQQTIELIDDRVSPTYLKIIPSVIGISVGSFILLAALVLRANRWLLRRKQPVDLFVTLFKRVQWYGNQFSSTDVTSYTPYELSAAFPGYLSVLSKNRYTNNKLEPLGLKITWLIRQYVSAVYSTKPPGVIEKARAIREWADVRRRLGFALVLKKLSDLRNRIGQKRVKRMSS